MATAAIGMIINPVHCAETGCHACSGDLQPHRVEECGCDPQIVLHVAGDGFASWRVVHDSFDRRELSEQAG